MIKTLKSGVKNLFFFLSCSVPNIGNTFQENIYVGTAYISTMRVIKDLVSPLIMISDLTG